MANINIGTGILELAANTARIQADLGRVSNMLGNFQRNAQKVFAGIGVGLSGAAFAGFVRGSIDAADRLNDLSKRTALTGQDLLVLEGAAVRGGVGLETVSDVASKLPARLEDARKGVGDSAAAFQAMGIKVTDSSGSLKTVGAILEETGRKFAGYKDGANKAALATAAFGRGGDRLVPVIEGLGETRERFEQLGIAIDSKLLTAADKFNDLMSDLKSVSSQLGRNISADLLPPLTRLATDFLNATTAANGFLGGLLLFATTSRDDVGKQIRDISSSIDELKAKRDALDRTAPRNFLEEFKKPGDLQALNEQIDALAPKLKYLKQIQVRQALQLPGVGDQDELRRYRPALADAPKLRDPNAEKAAADALIRLAEQRSKRELDIIKSAADFRQTLLDRSYQDNLVSHRAYFEQRIEIARTSLDAELAVLEREATRQAALVAKLEKAGKGSKEHTTAVGDLEETIAKRNELLVTFGRLVQTTGNDATRAAEEWRNGLERLNIELLEMQGNLTEAARRSAALDLANMKRQAVASEDTNAQALIAGVKRGREELVRRTQAAEEWGRTQDTLAVKEGLIQNALRTGSISELEALRRTGEARKATVDELQAQYDAEAAIYDQSATKTPAMLLRLEQMRLGIEQLAAESNLLADKFNTVFQDAFGSAFADAVSGTKSLKDAFQDMSKSILRNINDIIAKEFAQNLFGKPGSGSSIGDIAANLIKGLGRKPSITNDDEGNPLPSAGFSLVDWAMKLVSGRAAGGPIAAGRAYVVGEKGPELLVSGMAGRIIPNGAGADGGAITVIQNISTPDVGSFRASRNQIVGELTSAIAAARRNR